MDRRKQLHFMVSWSDTVAKVRQLFMPKGREKKKREEGGGNGRRDDGHLTLCCTGNKKKAEGKEQKALFSACAILERVIASAKHLPYRIVSYRSVPVRGFRKKEKKEILLSYRTGGKKSTIQFNSIQFNSILIAVPKVSKK